MTWPPDKRAFKELFEEYYPPLCNFANSLIKDWDLSQEIVQETFLKLWEQKQEIQINTSVKSYLFQSVKFLAIDYHRKLKHQKGKKEAYIQQVDLVEDGFRNTSEETALLRHHLYQAIHLLKPKMQEIFKLNKFEGLTYEEIAAHLNVSKRTVEDNMARAFKLLYEQLKDKR